MPLKPNTFTFNWKRHLKESFFIFLIGIPWSYLMCSNCTNRIWAIVINGSFWLILWKGNQVVSHLLDRYFPWLEQPLKRLFLGILGHSGFTVIAVLGMIEFYRVALNINIGDVDITILSSVGITILVTLFLQSRVFLISWKELAIESERTKKEAILAKYESLKNQVNPHFLFNSFNTLTNLVFEDQELAARFIKKLSDVYRYVLDARDKELVDLDEELEFVQAYVFLQKIRHEKGLNVEISIPENNQAQVPPMALQMLVENAIKHNVVSQDDPLHIRIIKTQDDYLQVENNLQKKNIVKEDRAGIGLANIKARYEFLSDKPVIIKDDDGKFTVALPLIDLAKS